MSMRGAIFWITLIIFAVGVYAGLTWSSPGATRWVKMASGAGLLLGAAAIFFTAEGSRKRKSQTAALALGFYGVAQFTSDTRVSLALIIPSAFVMWVAILGVPRSFFTESTPSSR